MATSLDPGGTVFLAARPIRKASPRLARAVLGSAFVLGILGDALLRQGPLGIGFPLLIAALVVALARLTRARGINWSLGATLLLVPIAVSSLTFAWRGSEVLLFYNLLALLAALTALGWALLRGDAWEPGAAGVGDYVVAAAKTGVSTAVGAFALIADARVGDLARDGAREGPLRHWPAVLRGAIVTVPVVFVFGALFSAADPVFEHVVQDVVNIDVGVVLSHVFLIGFFGWTAAGYLRGAAVAPIDDAVVVRRREHAPMRLGVIEVGVLLGALNALFLLFVVVQLRYLFGGAAHVQATAHMTYAEYARRGFFELVWVAAFALGTLIAANGALRRERARDEWVFRALAWCLLGLLAIVMLSAVQRMRLYQSEYGLTETRFYATVCMAWLGVVLAWFAATVLRGRGTPPFAFGALVSAWVAVAALDVANPDAFIARTNLARLEAGRRFDAGYVRQLSSDAAPVVAAALARLPAATSPADRCELQQTVVGWRRESSGGWRGWNASRAAARGIASAPAFAAIQPLSCAGGSTRSTGRGD